MGIYYAMANLSCGVICLILAFVFIFNKNAVNLIAGYNTLSAEDKAKYDTKRLAISICKLLFFWATIMLVSGIIIAINIAVWTMLIVSWSIFAITLIAALVHRSKPTKFKV